MTYDEALFWIHSTKKFGSKLGLDNINKLLEIMGNPHDKLKYIHVAGTNGKGSTCMFINSILIEAGFKTGLYTSPYIQSFNERIRINNIDIPNERLASICSYVKQCIDKMLEKNFAHPTEFEIITCIAFQYFLEEGCDLIVLEVGLGGRLDATNVIKKSEVSVITKIDYDHTEYLGDTIEKIAIEKAGIIKENSKVVLYKQDEAVKKVILEQCKNKNTTLFEFDFNNINIKKKDINHQVFSIPDFDNIEIFLNGEHQIYNAVTAIQSIYVLKQLGYIITWDNIIKGLRKATWPGRFEVINENPLFIVDGAHNPNGVDAFVKTYRGLFNDKKSIIIFGVMKDKDFIYMIKKISSIAKCIICVTPQNERALSANELAEFSKSYCNYVYVSDRIEEAIKLSIDFSETNDIICSLGSLYYIGNVREFFKR